MPTLRTIAGCWYSGGPLEPRSGTLFLYYSFSPRFSLWTATLLFLFLFSSVFTPCSSFAYKINSIVLFFFKMFRLRVLSFNCCSGGSKKYKGHRKFIPRCSGRTCQILGEALPCAHRLLLVSTFIIRLWPEADIVKFLSLIIPLTSVRFLC